MALFVRVACVFCDIGRRDRLAGTAAEDAMNLFGWIGLVVGVAIVLYLFAFLLNPEKFL